MIWVWRRNLHRCDSIYLECSQESIITMMYTLIRYYDNVNHVCEHWVSYYLTNHLYLVLQGRKILMTTHFKYFIFSFVLLFIWFFSGRISITSWFDDHPKVDHPIMKLGGHMTSHKIYVISCPGFLFIFIEDARQKRTVQYS